MDKEKNLMKKACTFCDRLYRNHGVISACVHLGRKNVHLTNEKFFEMFKEFETIKNYSGYSKVFVIEDGTEFFTLVEKESEE